MSVIAEDGVGAAMFKDIHADDENVQPTEIESLCMNCYENVSKQTTCAILLIYVFG